ncbi:MAG: TIGR04282 family arsenosugar biosynthesis glycosyltransferase [Bacteroidota bacterium]|nr:TIGR04282 family arsenosugar biosynthesis glycosyltransferase [Bacteroidota bacterium]
MRSSALIAFARPPLAGRVKTRLTGLITPREAADLYDAFLRDALDQYGRLEADAYLYLSEPYELDYLPSDIPCRIQASGDLGRKMTGAFEDIFAMGYQRTVIIGTDHPTLPDAYLEAAFEALEDPPALTVGPTVDGGFYLLGMTQLFPELFRDMSYSRPDVFLNTLQRARSARARVILLPAWYDVDRPADLHPLARSSHLPVHTKAVLRNLRQKYRL